MKIKLRCTIATADFRAPAGAIVDIDDDWAQSLISTNQADPVSAADSVVAATPEMPEEATDAPPETAQRRRRRQSEA